MPSRKSQPDGRSHRKVSLLRRQQDKLQEVLSVHIPEDLFLLPGSSFSEQRRLRLPARKRMELPDLRTARNAFLHDRTVHVRRTVFYAFLPHRNSCGSSRGTEPSACLIRFPLYSVLLIYLLQYQDADRPCHREETGDLHCR